MMGRISRNRAYLAELIGYSPDKIVQWGKEAVPAGPTLKHGLDIRTVESMGLVQSLFFVYKEIFETEHNKKSFCPCEKCALILPLDCESVSGKCPGCGGELLEYFNLEQIIESYSKDLDMKYNIMVQANGHVSAFTCGKLIGCRNYAMLLSDKYDLYRKRNPDIVSLNEKISLYFGLRDDASSKKPLLFADIGYVHPRFRGDLTQLVLSTRHLLYQAYREAAGRVICINYHRSSMYNLNVSLGFEAIGTYGDISFMCNTDVGPQLYLYQNFSPSAIRQTIKELFFQAKRTGLL